MNTNKLAEFFRRLATDISFRDFTHTQPELAFDGYKLSVDERRAMRELLDNNKQEMHSLDTGWCC